MKFLQILMDLGVLEDGIALFGGKVKESFESMEVCWGKGGGNLRIEGSLRAKRGKFVGTKRRKPSNRGKFVGKG